MGNNENAKDIICPVCDSTTVKLLVCH